VTFKNRLFTVLPNFAGIPTVWSIREVYLEKAEVCFVYVKKNWKEEVQWTENGEFILKTFL
jgi:uncharacterized protein YbdZ (MbtH family)